MILRNRAPETGTPYPVQASEECNLLLNVSCALIETRVSPAQRGGRGWGRERGGGCWRDACAADRVTWSPWRVDRGASAETERRHEPSLTRYEDGFLFERRQCGPANGQSRWRSASVGDRIRNPGSSAGPSREQPSSSTARPHRLRRRWGARGNAGVRSVRCCSSPKCSRPCFFHGWSSTIVTVGSIPHSGLLFIGCTTHVHRNQENPIPTRTCPSHTTFLEKSIRRPQSRNGRSDVCWYQWRLWPKTRGSNVDSDDKRK